MNKLIVSSAATLFVAAAANAGFNPSEWTVVGTGSLGGGNIAVDENKMLLTSPNDGSTLAGTLDAVWSNTSGGAISFNWTVVSSPDSGSFDSFGYTINGVYSVLAHNDTVGGGSLGLVLNAGDVFSFRIHSADNVFGSLQVSVTDFQYVPAPGAMAILGLAGLAARRRRTK